MHVRRLAIALAVSPDADLDRQLSVGGLLAPGKDGDSNVLRSLVETIAYLADVLSFEQDQIADEEFLETSYDRAADVVGLRFLADVRPVVCVVFDRDRAYVVAVGSDTGDASVTFGDGAQGERPPEGFETVAATYREGDGGSGKLEVHGLGLTEPFGLIAVSHHARRVKSVWQVYPPACRM